MLKRFLAIVLFVIAPWAVAANNPYQDMQVVANKVFAEISQHQAQFKQHPDQLKQLVRQDLLPYVQTKYSAALILGNYYKQATDAQKQAYFQAFEDYLVQATAQGLTLYQGQKYQIETPKSLDGKNMIAVRVLLLADQHSDQPIRIDFQWRKNSRTGNWKAFDIITEGVSMISTKQNEWASVLRQQGIDGLTRHLQAAAAQPVTYSEKGQK